MKNSPQRSGGLARAAALSPEQRRRQAERAANARWGNENPNSSEVNPMPEKPVSDQPVSQKSKVQRMHDKVSKSHAETVDAMLRELLIVLIERNGGSTAISVAEIEAATDRPLRMWLDEGWFYFEVKPKPVARTSGPDYSEH